MSIGKGLLDVRKVCPWQEEFPCLGLARRWRRSFRKRFVAVSAAESEGPERSWFRKFLFESIEVPDLDDDSDIGEDGEGEGEDGVEFEPRADADEPKRDEIDELIEDDRRFFRWKMKNDARSEVREFQASGIDPDSRDWEDWLDDSWSQYEEDLAGGQDGWYEAAPNWEKDGVPREPPSKPERGMKRTIKELLFRIFEPEEEVLEDLQFEERVFRFTSRTTVSSFSTPQYCLPAHSWNASSVLTQLVSRGKVWNATTLQWSRV
jgi:hypothetical protein